MRAVLACAFCALAAADLSHLRQLEQKHRFFELREALERPGDGSGETLLYRAITNARFGREREAVGQLRSFLATKPAADMERRARNELSSALTRIGDYAGAAGELAAALRLTPSDESGRPDAENVRVLLDTLRDVPAQSVEFGARTSIQARRNELGLWVLPVEVNSQRSEWIFDTGANFSTVSESEARRMGLAIREVNAHARGFTHAKSPVHLAVACELRVGPARLKNVVFLVLADRSLYVPQKNHQMNGIFGLPAMRALGAIEVSSSGAITFDPAANVQAKPNVFFDGLNAIVQVHHLGKTLQMMLDSGALGTLFYPSLRGSLADWELRQLSHSRVARLAGVGDSAERKAVMVPSIELDFRGRKIYLQRLNMFEEPPPGSTGVRDGILGIDALAGGFRLDFRAMEFTMK